MQILKYLLVFILFPVASIAQPPGFKPVTDTASLNKKISETAKKHKTIDCDFVQEKSLSVIADKIVSKGHFQFKQDNKLRWEYQDPFKYLVILNGTKIYIKDNNKENKVDMPSNKMFQEINNLISSSVQGKVSSNKSFKTKAFASEAFYLVEVTPVSKNVKEFFKTIEVYFDKNDYTVTKVNMIENSGDNTLITFKNKKFNLDISDEKFSFR